MYICARGALTSCHFDMVAKRDCLKMRSQAKDASVLRVRINGCLRSVQTHDKTFIFAVWLRDVNLFLSLRFVRCSRESKENLMTEGRVTGMLHLPGEKPAADRKEQGISAK